MTGTFIEFFAGVGLVHEALMQLGWTAVLANDNDPRKAATYRRNYSQVPFREECVKDLDVTGLPPVDLATASFPCIDLSQAGNRAGINGRHSGLVWTFLNKIREMQADGNAPRYLLIENVPNLLSIHEGRAVDELLTAINALGYAVDLIQVNASSFTPQSRNRAFVVAVRTDLVDRSSSSFREHHIRRYRVKEAYHRNDRLDWFFHDFPALPENTPTISDVVERLDDHDPRWWSSDQVNYFWDLLEHDHRIQLKSLLDEGISSCFTAVRRLRRRGKREQIFNIRFDGTASCLRTPKGGSSTQYIIEIGNGVLRGRRITGREAGRLQGVCLPNSAPDYIIPDRETTALYAFGDAVCVPAVKWIMSHSIQRHQTGDRRDHPAELLPLLREAA